MYYFPKEYSNTSSKYKITKLYNEIINEFKTNNIQEPIEQGGTIYMNPHFLSILLEFKESNFSFNDLNDKFNLNIDNILSIYNKIKSYKEFTKTDSKKLEKNREFHNYLINILNRYNVFSRPFDYYDSGSIMEKYINDKNNYLKFKLFMDCLYLLSLQEIYNIDGNFVNHKIRINDETLELDSKDSYSPSTGEMSSLSYLTSIIVYLNRMDCFYDFLKEYKLKEIKNFIKENIDYSDVMHQILRGRKNVILKKMIMKLEDQNTFDYGLIEENDLNITTKLIKSEGTINETIYKNGHVFKTIEIKTFGDCVGGKLCVYNDNGVILKKLIMRNEILEIIQ
jgi:hypothetical protein